MRKAMVAITMILVFVGITWAERTVTLNKVDRVMGRLFFGAVVNVVEGEEDVTYYAPLAFAANVKATSSDGFSIVVSSQVTFGALRKTPYTKKESWGFLPAALKPIFKHLYHEAIEVDLSQ